MDQLQHTQAAAGVDAGPRLVVLDHFHYASDIVRTLKRARTRGALASACTHRTLR